MRLSHNPCLKSFKFAAGAHALLLLGVTRQGQARRLLHTAGWALQLLLWFACILGSFFMPNSVFGVYGQIAKVCLRSTVLSHVYSSPVGTVAGTVDENPADTWRKSYARLGSMMGAPSIARMV